MPFMWKEHIYKNTVGVYFLLEGIYISLGNLAMVMKTV